jgi:hypothetical protein
MMLVKAGEGNGGCRAGGAGGGRYDMRRILIAAILGAAAAVGLQHHDLIQYLKIKQMSLGDRASRERSCERRAPLSAGRPRGR